MKMTEAGVCGEGEKPISVAAAAKSYGLGEWQVVVTTFHGF
jgi:hypothetical protein